MWYRMWMPKRVPKAVVAKINASVLSTLAEPTVRKKFADQRTEVFPGEQQTPEALAACSSSKNGKEKWWPIIKAANIRGE
jgi:tripartite-type tricarboxylate transporter receptor subunit TctC